MKSIRTFTTTARCLNIQSVEPLYSTHNIPPENITELVDYSLDSGLWSSYRQQKRDPSVRFKDVAIVKLASGPGGAGKVSFLRDTGRSVGPPDGGDGGNGGSVYVRAVPGMNSLHSLRHIYKAQSGRPGGSSQLTGKSGENVVLDVPIGTRVCYAPELSVLKELYAQTGDSGSLMSKVEVITNFSRFDTAGIQLRRPRGGGWTFKDQKDMDQPYFKKLQQKVKVYDLIAERQEQMQDIFPLRGLDLVEQAAPFKLLGGGSGGMGNIHFQTGEVRNPRFAKLGRPGLEATFIFELKLLADIGLVGQPNAGKSTLLGAISRAQPNTGPWEFTTLTPTVGHISTGIDEPTFSVADIPGIIAGSSQNKGLGLGFLRHIERSKGLVFVIGLDSEDPVANLATLLTELGHRSKGKRGLIVATKADLEGSSEKYGLLAARAHELGYDITACSATEGGNLETVVRKMSELVFKETSQTALQTKMS